MSKSSFSITPSASFPPPPHPPLPATYTPWETVQSHHQTLHQTFRTNHTKPLAWRKWQLKQLWFLLTDNTPAIISALAADLRRHPTEAISSDIVHLKTDILRTLKMLPALTRDQKVKDAGMIFRWLAPTRVLREPRGVAFVIGAWNFPFLLALQPVIAAISAGCCVLLKPSEMASASQELLVRLVNEYMDPAAIKVVTGGAEETRRILELKFDHIFFTGSTAVGQAVAIAAARQLTPVVLELGGQDPAIVGKSTNIDLSAKRIAFSKVLNGGQICLAVNHVFVEPEVHDEFVVRLEYWFGVFMSGEGHMCRVINQRHFERLTALLLQSKGVVKRIHGVVEEDNFVFAPAIVTGIDVDDSTMSQELFSPILPIIKATVPEAISYTNARPSPLALYIFSNDKAEVNHILNNTLSGGVTVNDTIIHYMVTSAPFGGVGDSGYGYYHGKHGFMAFTHERTVCEVPWWLERVLKERDLPYDITKVKRMRVKNTLGFRRGEGLEGQVEREGVWQRMKGRLRAGYDDVDELPRRKKS